LKRRSGPGGDEQGLGAIGRDVEIAEHQLTLSVSQIAAQHAERPATGALNAVVGEKFLAGCPADTPDVLNVSKHILLFGAPFNHIPDAVTVGQSHANWLRTKELRRIA
jgi:hypothetical protein